MSLTAVIAGIHADSLLTNYPSPLQGTVAVQATLGAEARAVRSTAPLVVWIPTSDTYGPANPQGVSPPTVTGGIARAIKTRIIGIEAHIHAELNPVGNIVDFATCEDLLNRFIFALHRQTRGSYQVLRGEFEGAKEGTLIRDRKVYILTLEVHVPIYEPSGVSTSVVINAVPFAGGMSFSDGNTVGPSIPPP